MYLDLILDMQGYGFWIRGKCRDMGHEAWLAAAGPRRYKYIPYILLYELICIMYNVQAQFTVISYQLQLHVRISAASAVSSQPRPASGL